MSADYKSCEKCGETTLQPPRYVNDLRGERLQRICPRCGYVTSEKCADAR